MIGLKRKEDCCGCASCAQSCPRQCIIMQLDNEGFVYPQIDRNNCINCGLCEKVCPIVNKHMETGQATQAVAAFNVDDSERMQSSSGGIFSLLSKHIIENNGIVFGATFSADYRKVYHTAVESINELPVLQGSKYLQSEIGNIFQEAKKELEKGRYVLFSGTPCEIEGFKSFLHKDYEKLVCVDIVCHGVPSPLLWEKYVSYREQCAGASVKYVGFRNKEHGWKKYCIKFIFLNNSVYKCCFSKDLYMQMFLQNLCLRPSCYECKFKKIQHASDFTLADLWGSEEVCPEMDDDKGLSLIIIHTEKGRKIYQAIQKSIKTKPIDLEMAIKNNTAMICSCGKPVRRDNFIHDLDCISIPELARKYIQSPPLIEKISALIPRKQKNKLKKLVAFMKYYK